MTHDLGGRCLFLRREGFVSPHANGLRCRGQLAGFLRRLLFQRLANEHLFIASRPHVWVWVAVIRRDHCLFASPRVAHRPRIKRPDWPHAFRVLVSTCEPTDGTGPPLTTTHASLGDPLSSRRSISCS